MAIKLNLGSHSKSIGEDYINVEIQDLNNVDLNCDLSKVPFEFVVKQQHKLKGNEWDFLFEYNLSGRTLFRLPNNFADEIVMEEVLEHISFRKTTIVLKEIFRILKVEGKLRIQVPDCGSTMRAWVDGKVCNCVPHKAFVDGTFRAKSDCKICGGKAIMDWERWLFSFTGAGKNKYDFHLAIFTKDILEKELRKAGFTEYKFIDNPVKLKVEATK